MQKPVESVICQNCEKKLRPPFLACRNDHMVCGNCDKHQDSSTGIIKNCCKKKTFELSLLNIMFINTIDFCQYNCGYRCNILELGNHELSCLERDKIINCPIINCEWTNSIKRLIPHFDEDHPNLLKSVSNTEEDLILSIQTPIALITQFDKNHPNNEIYWARLLEDDSGRYIILLHQGQIGWRVDPDRRLNEFLIYSIGNHNHFIKSEIISTDGDINDMNFIKNSGRLVTALGEGDYVIKLNTSIASPMPENILNTLECPICMETMRAPIFCCEIGHSYCGGCTRRMENCPTCRRNMTNVRNFSLEQLGDSLDYNCIFKTVGCGLVGTKQEMQIHGKKCEFRATKCSFFSCNWIGTYHGMLKHWEEDHPNWIKQNGCTFTGRLGNRYLYHVSGNDFIFKGVCDEENFCLSVHHLTPEDKTDFYFDLELKNARTGQTIGYTCKCLPDATNVFTNSSFLDTSADVFITPIKWFKNAIVNSDNGFIRTVTIYKK